MKIRYLLLIALGVSLIGLPPSTGHRAEGAQSGTPEMSAPEVDRIMTPAGQSVGNDPNVLVIMTDDQRASPDGLKVMDNLRRIFRNRGTYFPNAVATTPLCCPSRASIFTGKYVHNHRVTTQKDATRMPQDWTMQYQLKKHGYTTALVGKYLNNWSGRKPHLDHVRSGVFTDYYSGNGVYTTRATRDHSLSLLKKFEGRDRKPWLMYIHPFAPHIPSIPQKKYRRAPVPRWRDNPARRERDLSDKPPYIEKRAATTSLNDQKKLRKRMIRTLYSVDDMIGAIFKKLNRLGERNTIAFFLSDNGWMWFEHGLDRKEVAYNPAVKIPMYVRWPGHVRKGAKDRSIVANIDIAPTVYDAANLNPQGYRPDGKSMFTSSRNHILTEFRANNPWRALWHPNWMYTEYDNGFREYYGPNDPWQLRNGFETGGPPPNAARLRRKLLEDSHCSGPSCP